MATELLYIDCDDIIESKTSLRVVDEENEEFQLMIDSVRSRGILNPINVRRLDNGKFGLIDGLQRWTAAKRAGLKTIPAQVVDIEEGELLEAQIIANAVKIETQPAAYSQALNNLLMLNPTLTMLELSQRLNRSQAWLSERLSLIKLTDELKELVNEGKIVLTNAYALAKVPRERQHEFIEHAMTQSPAEFVPTMNALVKEIKDAKRQGRETKVGYLHVPRLRKIQEIKDALEGSLPVELLSRLSVSEPVAAFRLALQWTLKSDPITVDELEKKWLADKERQKLDAERRKEEREMKRREEANLTAQKLME